MAIKGHLALEMQRLLKFNSIHDKALLFKNRGL